MRILVLTSTYPRWKQDSVPEFIHNLCKNLVASGLQIDVLAPHSAHAMSEEIIDGVRITRYKYFFPVSLQQLTYGSGIKENLVQNPALLLLIPFFMVAMLYKSIKFIRINKYDYIHAHWLIPQGLVAVLAKQLSGQKKVEIICTAHGSDVFGLKSKVIVMIRGWVIKHCAHVSVVSKSLQKYLVNEGVDSSRLKVLPMGVNLKSVFYNIENIKRNSNRILYVGRMVESKGILVLLNAFISIVKQFPDMELYLVGEGPLLPKIQSLARENDIEKNIIVAGYVPNNHLPSIYSSSAITVVPSFSEGLGLVTIEAMGCGSVVVASDIDAIGEIVVHEQTGLLVKPDDACSLVNAITRLLNNPELCKSMSKNARAHVVEKFDWQTVAAGYKQLYESP